MAIAPRDSRSFARWNTGHPSGPDRESYTLLTD